MTELNEETRGMTADEMLDWICWNAAIDGESIYPPEETARKYIKNAEIDTKRGRGKQLGSFTERWIAVVELFDDLENFGFDPRGRVERHIEQSREEGLDLSDIDWEWWEVTQ